MTITKKLVASSTLPLALAGGAVVASVGAANAAPPSAGIEDATKISAGSVGLAEDGSTTTEGNLGAPVESEPFADTSETQAKTKETEAKYPDSAAISVDKDGNVIATPLEKGQNEFTFTDNHGHGHVEPGRLPGAPTPWTRPTTTTSSSPKSPTRRPRGPTRRLRRQLPQTFRPPTWAPPSEDTPVTAIPGNSHRQHAGVHRHRRSTQRQHQHRGQRMRP